MKEPTWNQWIAEHCETCEQCCLSMEEMEGSLCEVAFAKMKEYAKEDADARE